MPDYFTPYGNAMAYKQYPTRVISGPDILELGSEQQQTLIGHTLGYCNELESALNEAVSKAEGFYNRLVELGDIVPPKSAEELLQEQNSQQQKINETLLSTIQKLSDKIDRMEDKHAKPTTNSNDSSEGSEAGACGSGRKGTKQLHA